MKKIILLFPIVFLGLSSCSTKLKYIKNSLLYFPNDKYPTYMNCSGMTTTINDNSSHQSFTIDSNNMQSTIDSDNIVLSSFAEDNTIIVEYNIDKYIPNKNYDIPISKDYIYTITSSCDNTGTDKYNIKLSQKRANYISDFLLSQGLSSDNIKIYAVGKNGKRQSKIQWTTKI